jgi:hypothetical protein
VLIGSPVGEAAKVFKYFFGIGVEYVWAIFVYQNTIVIVKIVGVASEALR